MALENETTNQWMLSLISKMPCARMRRSCGLGWVSYYMYATSQARHTALHSLLEHPVDHIWTMPREQGFDMSHGLVVDI